MYEEGLNLRADPPIVSVGQLTYRIKDLLEAEIGRVWVLGELSNVRVYASGHLYFSLKDRQAQLSGVMWQSRLRGLRFRPAEGMRVVVDGAVSLYPPRGQYQIIAERMRLDGEGALRQAFEALKARLAGEGLFDEALKRALPTWPRRICLVTSRDGAALRDMVRVIHDRAPWVELVLVPSRVQGQAAPGELLAGLRRANSYAEADLVVLARGGGSQEDLWAFNDERLARAIRASRLPVVSAVGHETDWTISDLVADLRLATPSHTALLVPDGTELRRRLGRAQRRLRRALRARVQGCRLELSELSRRLDRAEPRRLLLRTKQRLREGEARLYAAMRRQLERSRMQLAQRSARLDALSPLAVLGRGYGLPRRGEDGPVVRRWSELRQGDPLHVTLAEGSVSARVESTLPPKGERSP